MTHGVFGRDALRVVVPEHLTEQVEGLVAHQMSVLLIDKLGPGLARDGVLGQQVLVVRVERQAVLVKVSVKFFSAEHFGNLDELVVVVATLEEGLPLEDHTGEHAAEGPDVERVVISLQVDEQLGSLEVT